MHYLVYKITNKINDKFYIGAHKTNNKDDDYMGSGLSLKKAIQKYGLDNFSKEILVECNSSEEMYQKEKELVVVDDNTYNLKLGGFGGWDHLKGIKQEFTQNRIDGHKCRSNKLKNRKNPSASKRMKQHHIEGKIKYDTFTNKSHTKETKQKIGLKNSENQKGNKNSQFNTMWITNGVENKKIMNDDIIPEGWYKGRKIK